MSSGGGHASSFSDTFPQHSCAGVGPPGRPLHGIMGRLSRGTRVCICSVQGQPHLQGQLGRIVDWDASLSTYKVAMDDGSLKAMIPEDLQPCCDSDPSAALDPGRPATPSEDAHEALSVGDIVAVSGLQARAELNGQIGQLVAWDEMAERWKVRLLDGTGKSFKAANLKLCTSVEQHEARTPAVPHTAFATQPHVQLAGRETGAEDAVRTQGSGQLTSALLPICSSHLGRSNSHNFFPGARVRVFGLRDQFHFNGKVGVLVAWDRSQERWRVMMDDGSGILLRPANLELLGESELMPMEGHVDA